MNRLKKDVKNWNKVILDLKLIFSHESWLRQSVF